MKKNSFEKIINKNNKKIFVIAEMSGNHQNSFKVAKKFVSSCIKNGADIIKFQVYKPDTITIISNKPDFRLKKTDKIWGNYNYLHELYQKAHTPWEWIEKLAKNLNKKKFPWFASVFDISSVDFLEKLKCKAYKIASPEITDIPLIEYVAKLNKPIIMSSGLAKLNDLELAVKTIKKFHNKFMILKCTSSYPAKKEELDLNSIKLISEEFKCPVGFSDHTIGCEAAKIAASIGSKVFEKHFKLNNDKKSIDKHFSMNLSELKKYKYEINETILMMGKSRINIPTSVKNNYSGRRSIYVVKDIKVGEKFTLENIKSVRPNYSLHPKYLKTMLGKKSNKKLFKGDRLKLGYISK